MKKIGLFFGGLGNESEISIKSAKNIALNIDNKKYALFLIYWDKNGNFYLIKNIENLNIENGKKILPQDFKKYFDIAFPITHGKYGEDGCLQSIFEIYGIKYCGCKVLASSLCMDKSIFKEFISGRNIKQAKFLNIDTREFLEEKTQEIIKKIERNFKMPVFIKPSNSGSSVGITKVDKKSEIRRAILLARKHDPKVIVEEGLKDFREIEIAVLGNNELIVSNPGELVVDLGFYNYDNKYKLNKTKIIIPARLDKYLKRKVVDIAKKAYKICDCKGFARVDFFIKGKSVYLNEINTLPGFTDISMFPLLMKNKKIDYKELISKIISLAF